MSYMVVNVLLRGLVIYAVLGLECTYSNDLPGHSSDAANVATTGKRSPCLIGVYTLFTYVQYHHPPTRHPPSPFPGPRWFSRGKPRNALRSDGEDAFLPPCHAPL